MKLTPTLVDTRAARLATALAAREMTRDDLATLLRCSAPAVTRWATRPAVRRGGPPAAVTTEAVAAALDLDPAALEPGGPWGALVGEEVVP